MPLFALKHLHGHVRQSGFLFIFHYFTFHCVHICTHHLILSRFLFYLNTKDIGLKKKKVQRYWVKIKNVHKYLITFNHGRHTSLTLVGGKMHWRCVTLTHWMGVISEPPCIAPINLFTFPCNVMHIRHTIATCTCLPDTWGIRVQTPTLRMACNFADTQWRRSGYKLCIMCPEGEEPVRRRRASLSGVTLGALLRTMSHPPQLRRSPWPVLLLVNRKTHLTHLPHLGVTQTCTVLYYGFSFFCHLSTQQLISLYLLFCTF